MEERQNKTKITLSILKVTESGGINIHTILKICIFKGNNTLMGKGNYLLLDTKKTEMNVHKQAYNSFSKPVHD